MRSPLEKAIKYAGSKNRLATLLGVDHQLIDYWVTRGNPPSNWWQKLEQATKIKAQQFFDQEMRLKK